MIDTIIFDVGRVLVNWDYESYLKRFAFGPEKTKAIAAATFESPYWRQFDRGILAPEEIVKGFCSLAPEYTEEIKEVISEIIGDKEKYNEMKQAAEKSKKDFFYSEIAKKAIEQ